MSSAGLMRVEGFQPLHVFSRSVNDNGEKIFWDLVRNAGFVTNQVMKRFMRQNIRTPNPYQELSGLTKNFYSKFSGNSYFANKFGNKTSSVFRQLKRAKSFPGARGDSGKGLVGAIRYKPNKQKLRVTIGFLDNNVEEEATGFQKGGSYKITPKMRKMFFALAERTQKNKRKNKRIMRLSSSKSHIKIPPRPVVKPTADIILKKLPEILIHRLAHNYQRLINKAMLGKKDFALLESYEKFGEFLTK